MTEEDCRFLTYKIGEEWHEHKPDIYHPEGCLCGHDFFPACPSNRDFDNWEDFGLIWEWATEREWWEEFMWFCGERFTEKNCLDLIHPDRFPQLITNFLREREWK